MHVRLSYSELQPVGHSYLNCLLSCSCIIYPAKLLRAEHLSIAELFKLEMDGLFFLNFNRIDSEKESTVTVDSDE